MSIVVDLDGVVVARGNADKNGIAISLMASSGFVDGKYFYPAESITIDHLEGIYALRDALTQLIEQHEALKDGGKSLPPIELLGRLS